MLQQRTNTQRTEHEQIARRFARPGRLAIFFHGIKTFRLVKALIGDRRVPLHRKALFFGSLGGMLVILLFPDLLGETFLSAVLPIIGTIAGVPLDVGFDWLAFAFVSVQLLRFFPAEIVSEHYNNIF